MHNLLPIVIQKSNCNCNCHRHSPAQDLDNAHIVHTEVVGGLVGTTSATHPPITFLQLSKILLQTPKMLLLLPLTRPGS